MGKLRIVKPTRAEKKIIGKRLKKMYGTKTGLRKKPLTTVRTRAITKRLRNSLTAAEVRKLRGKK